MTGCEKDRLQLVATSLLFLLEPLQLQPNGSCNPLDQQLWFGPNWLWSSSVAGFLKSPRLDFKTLMTFMDCNEVVRNITGSRNTVVGTYLVISNDKPY